LSICNLHLPPTSFRRHSWTPHLRSRCTSTALIPVEELVTRRGGTAVADWSIFTVLKAPPRRTRPTARVRYASLPKACFRRRHAPRGAGPWRSGHIPRKEGELDMSQPMLRRYVVVGTLALTMGLVGSNPVQAREIGTAGRTWQWVQEAWTLGVQMVWSRVPVSRVVEKEGWGLDPNGKPAPAPPPPTAAGPTCETCNSLGWGIDPNG
jgi:hypothetical protein